MGKLLDWWTGTDKEIERGKALDSNVDAYQKKQLAAGAWSQDQYVQAQKNLYADGPDTYSAQVSGGFEEGWADGRKNVSGAIKGTINTVIGEPLRAILGGIPWWVWVAGIGWVLWKFGVLGTLVKKVVK